MNEFENLLVRTHRSGMKAIIDFVPNHVARQYHSDSKPEGVVDLGESDDITKNFSANNNFYYINGADFNPQFSLDDGTGNKYTESPCRATGNDYFRIVTSGGNYSHNFASSSGGVALGFCL